MCFLVDPEDWPKLRRDFLSHELCQWPRSRPTCAPLYSHCHFPPLLFLPSFPRDTRFFNPSLPLFLPLSFSPSLSLSIFLFSPSVFFKRFSSSVTCNEQLHRRIVHRVKGKWANFFPRLISLFSPSLFWIFLLNFISSCFFFDDGLWEFISFSAIENSFIFFSSYCFFSFCYIIC